MNQKTSRLFAVALAVIAFAGCNKSDDPTPEEKVAVSFETTLQGPIATPDNIVSKAAGSIWATNDAIGVFMVDNGTTDIAESALNRKYTAASNGSSASFSATGDQVIYYPNKAVDFIAYYPYDEDLTSLGTIAVDVSGTQTTASQATIDLLYGTADNDEEGYMNHKSPVTMQFIHQLTRIEMNVIAGNGVTSLEGMTASITGFKTKNTFDLATGELGTPNTPATITPRTVTANKQFDAIILPGTIAVADGAKVTFTVDGVKYLWNIETHEFKAGKQHIFDVTLTKGGVEITGTIKDWETVNEDPVTAEIE